jgi:zinc protease
MLTHDGRLIQFFVAHRPKGQHLLLFHKYGVRGGDTFEVNKKCWGDLMTRKNPIGDHEIINTATPQKMMIIKDKYYHPNNSILVICGDVKPDEAFANANKIFGDWANSGFDPHQKYPIPEFKPIEKTSYFIKESSLSKTPFVMLQWQGPDYRKDSAATIAANVFSTLLSLNASKWQQALIDKGLASEISMSYQTSKYVGPIGLFAVPNPTKLKAFHAEMLNQLNNMAAPDYFTEEQLTTAKENLLRNKIRREEKPSSLPSALTFWWCSTSLDYFADYNTNMQKIGLADINRFVKKYITAKPYIAGLIISAEMNKQIKANDFFIAAQ